METTKKVLERVLSRIEKSRHRHYRIFNFYESVTQIVLSEIRKAEDASERDKIIAYLEEEGSHDFDGANGYLDAARDIKQGRHL